jgi:hypothetical protein
MVERFLFRDRTLLNQDLYMAVIPGSLKQFALAHVVDPAIANVTPPGTAFLDETHGTGGPRPKIHGEIRADFDDFIVRSGHGRIQEALRIKQWQIRRHELILHDPEPYLGSLCAVLVTAHAIKHQHDCGILGNHDRRPVLVVLPVTDR